MNQGKAVDYYGLCEAIFIDSGERYYSVAETETNLTDSIDSIPYARFDSSASFDGLDFEGVWYLDPATNSDFPQLRGLPEHMKLSECLLLLPKGGVSSPLKATFGGSTCSVTWSSDDVTVAAVRYDGSGRFLGCTLQPVELESGRNPSGFPADPAVDQTDKLMLIDSDSFIPLQGSK